MKKTHFFAIFPEKTVFSRLYLGVLDNDIRNIGVLLSLSIRVHLLIDIVNVFI